MFWLTPNPRQQKMAKPVPRNDTTRPRHPESSTVRSLKSNENLCALNLLGFLSHVTGPPGHRSFPEDLETRGPRPGELGASHSLAGLEAGSSVIAPAFRIQAVHPSDETPTVKFLSLKRAFLKCRPGVTKVQTTRHQQEVLR